MLFTRTSGNRSKLSNLWSAKITPKTRTTIMNFSSARSSFSLSAPQNIQQGTHFLRFSLSPCHKATLVAPNHYNMINATQLELGTFSNDCCRASGASLDILPIYFKMPYFCSSPGVDSVAIRNIWIVSTFIHNCCVVTVHPKLNAR